MRIAYGIHGYGRGHVMRALALLPELAKRHDLLVFAGSDAFHAVEDRYSIVRIPNFGFYYKGPSRISNFRTCMLNFPAYLDLKFEGPTVDMVAECLAEYVADVVISDSEAFTLRAARKLGIPRIICDHFGLLAFARPEMSAVDRIVCRGQSFVYKQLYGKPDRAVVCGFFDAVPMREGIRVVGPIIRDEVREVKASQGEHLLVYISKGDKEWTSQIERALVDLDYPTQVFGAPRYDTLGQIQFRPLSNRAFIESLASCRAVFATTGNQLIGELIYFGKPMLGMPINCLEQRLNARHLVKMGLGMTVKRERLNTGVLREFLNRCDAFAANARRHWHDGRAEAIDALEQHMAELADAKDRNHELIPKWQAAS